MDNINYERYIIYFGNYHSIYDRRPRIKKMKNKIKIKTRSMCLVFATHWYWTRDAPWYITIRYLGRIFTTSQTNLCIILHLYDTSFLFFSSAVNLRHCPWWYCSVLYTIQTIVRTEKTELYQKPYHYASPHKNLFAIRLID